MVAPMPIQVEQLQQKLPVIEVNAGPPPCYFDETGSAFPSSSSSLNPSPLPSPQMPRRSLRISQTSVTSLDPNGLCDPIASSTSSTPKSTPSKSVRFSFTSPTIIPIHYDDPSNGEAWSSPSSCKRPNHRCAKFSSIFLLCFTFLGFVGVLSIHFLSK